MKNSLIVSDQVNTAKGAGTLLKAKLQMEMDSIGSLFRISAFKMVTIV